MLGRLSGLLVALFAMGMPTMGFGQTGPGTLERHEAFASAHVDSRNVTVWLPPGYEKGDGRYAVLYMHDGQNIFEPGTSYGGQEWGVDEALAKLMADGTVRDTIVVGIWNTPKRYLEYFPEEAFRRLPAEMQTAFVQTAGGKPLSDAYLTFLVTELKPFIDAKYRTRPDRENTTIMGSSMGGLISTYALTRHPEVFGAAGAVSTHWPMAHPEQLPAEQREMLFGAMLSVVADGLKPAKGRIYFDFGTLNLDSYYEPLQIRVDAAMAANGFTRDKDWVTRKFEGGDHNEASWRERVHIPLTFLLGTGN